MSKQLKNVIYTVAALLIAIAALVVILQFKPVTEETKEEPKITVLKHSESEVLKIRYKTQHDDFTVDVTEQLYKIQGFKDINVFSISSVFAMVSNSINIYASDKINPKETTTHFGFDKPETVVEITFKDNTKKTVTFGSVVVLGNRRYCKVSGDESVYFVSSDISNVVNVSPASLANLNISQKVEDEYIYDINKVEITGKNRTDGVGIYKASKSAVGQLTSFSTYRSLLPFKGLDMNPDAIEVKILQPLSKLIANDAILAYPTDKELKNYGLYTPNYVLEYEILGTKFKLNIGNKDADGFFFVMREDIPIIYRVSEEYLPFLDVEFSQLKSNTAIVRLIDEVSSVIAEYDGKNRVFELTPNGTDIFVYEKGKKIDTEAFRKAYVSMLSIFKASDTGLPANKGMVLKITFKYHNNSPSDVVEYVAVDSRKCYVKLNGKGQFYVYRSDVQKAITDIEKF